MELRFFMGYIIGASLLAFLSYYDFGNLAILVIGFVVYAGTQYIVHGIFDK